ncbi:MAG: hypothetical protein U0Z44_11070 [Kouleothrix sp.]
MYRIYERQVHSWIYRHPQFPLAGESAEFFASAAWSRFFFALRGAKVGETASAAAGAGLPQAVRLHHG